jgi:hypothetical protein
MILVRQVFQVKFGHMDEVLAAVKAATNSGVSMSNITRVLTDISGNNFTLVFETKAESVDAYWAALQAMFKDPGQMTPSDPFRQYIESGH